MSRNGESDTRESGTGKEGRPAFGPWRKVEVTQSDIRRACNQLGRHLTAIGETLAGKELSTARCDLAKAREAYLSADPREGSPDLLLLLDNTLSYAHRAIDDLLHESGLPSHHPMDFASWSDAPEVPFQRVFEFSLFGGGGL